MISSYQLNNGHTLYFSSLHNRFRIGNSEFNEQPVYYSTELNYIRIEISHACNGNCNYCIVFGNMIENLSKINVVELWKWLNLQPWFTKITGIFIIGGEPLIFFDELQFIMDHFEGDIHFSTNGTLITPEMAKRMKKRDVLVYVSLDGLTEYENRNRIYKNGGYMYDDIIRGLSYLENEGVRKGIFMVSTKENITGIVDTMSELSKNYHLMRIGYSLPHWTIHESNIVSPQQYRDALISIFKHRKEIKASVMQVAWRLSPLFTGKIKKFACALHTEQITILPDHSLVRCSKIDHDPELKKISNSVLDAGCPMEIYKDANSNCSKCIALGVCGGGCPYDGMKRFNTIIDQRECIITPPLIQTAIDDIIHSINMSDISINGYVDQNIIENAII